MATAKLQRIRNAARRVRPPTASRIPPPSSAATDAYAKSFGDDSNGAPMWLTPSKNSVCIGSGWFAPPGIAKSCPAPPRQTRRPPEALLEHRGSQGFFLLPSPYRLEQLSGNICHG